MNSIRKRIGPKTLDDSLFPVGAIIGVAEVVGCVLMNEDLEDNPWASGPECWVLGNAPSTSPSSNRAMARALPTHPVLPRPRPGSGNREPTKRFGIPDTTRPVLVDVDRVQFAFDAYSPLPLVICQQEATGILMGDPRWRLTPMPRFNDGPEIERYYVWLFGIKVKVPYERRIAPQ